MDAMAAVVMDCGARPELSFELSAGRAPHNTPSRTRSSVTYRCRYARWSVITRSGVPNVLRRAAAASDAGVGPPRQDGGKRGHVRLPAVKLEPSARNVERPQHAEAVHPHRATGNRGRAGFPRWAAPCRADTRCARRRARPGARTSCRSTTCSSRLASARARP